MATASQMGLVKGSNAMMIEIYRLSKLYSDVPRWQGFTKFVIYRPQNDTEMMRILKTDNPLRPDIERIGLSVNIIPDLVRLHQTVPDLFEEVILALLAHEGGKVGHLMLWPIASIDEAVKYFNWKQLDSQTALLLIHNFVRGIWPRAILDAGTPPFDQWLTALTIIKETLGRFGYDRDRPGPYGVLWKEAQAMYGMVQDRGVRSAAIFLWFIRDFRKMNVNLQNEFAQQFYFLNTQERHRVIVMMSEIQKEYKQQANPRSGFISNMFNK